MLKKNEANNFFISLNRYTQLTFEFLTDIENNFDTVAKVH